MTEDVVFVVDDDPAVCASLSRSLRKRGYAVEAFQSAGEFLAAFGTGRPGCLVLDFGMPGMNGLELQEHLIVERLAIPVIFITGHGGIPEAVKATQAGAIDFLEKPYRPAALVERIEEALEIGRGWRAAAAQEAQLLARLDSLTEREAQICAFILAHPDQHSSKAIARALDLSPRTVDIHRARILQKTGCASVAELASTYQGLSNPRGARSDKSAD